MDDVKKQISSYKNDNTKDESQLLTNLKTKVENNTINFNGLQEPKEKALILKIAFEPLKEIFNYTDVQPKLSTFFEKNINPKTCYYCNIDFINKFEKSYDSIWHFLNNAGKNELLGQNGGIPQIGPTTAEEIIVQRERGQRTFRNYSDIIFLNSKQVEEVKKFEANRNYTNIKTRNGFTLDHVLDKATKPYFAVSLFNLVPSCYICNSKLKGSKEIGDVSPSSDKFDFHETVKFKTYFSANNGKLQIEEPSNIEVYLNEFGNEYDDYIEVFRLNDRYAFHRYRVIEMIDKRKRYPDSRIRELANQTNQTFAQVKKDLFGDYWIKEVDFHKRPLSKLTRDIAEELGLI